jgi:hypothetical protein
LWDVPGIVSAFFTLPFHIDSLEYIPSGAKKIIFGQNGNYAGKVVVKRRTVS